MHVTVVHLADRLMEQQLDALAASMLAPALRELRIAPGCDAHEAQLAGRRPRPRPSRWPTAQALRRDLVVIATGIRPEVDARARPPAWRSRAGSSSTTSCARARPDVWAVGECAEHRGVVYGLWAPLLEQAKAAARRSRRARRRSTAPSPATTLKVAGVELFCCGRRCRCEDGDEEVLTLDTRRGRYRRLLLARRPAGGRDRCSAT